MKKFLASSFVLIFMCACVQAKSKIKIVPEGKQIVIMNPTVDNIKTFMFLIKNNILKDIDSFGIIGLYHKKQNYDFDKSRKYIDKNNIKIELIGCSGKLNPENLYKKNDCSKIFEQIFEQTKGVFLFGGPDIPAGCYHEKTHLMSSTQDPYRHFFELSFMFHLLGGYQDTTYMPLLEKNDKYVIVGFCLGMQTMNCATGGTMYQDIQMEIYNLYTANDVLSTPNAAHENYNKYFDYDDKLVFYNFHKIVSVGNSAMAQIIGKNSPYVISAHHQAVKKLGKNFEIAATSTDGKVIEAIINTKFPHVIGTQFHPEYTGIYKSDCYIKLNFDDPDNQSFKGIFKNDSSENMHLNYWKLISKWLNE